ncbi:NUDIX domain-containing protein [Amaricoccus sp.]|uniref:NUDIX domain-containing protein n=1 Tax=Amaricoccus sp. TaxID=1872485 RepID=UPI0026381DF8|nr:NUDIX domain-containing protein [Amaricoccus sp.]HRO12497.1 NUDIX domain-containing protein [Amaricoccus sp.]
MSAPRVAVRAVLVLRGRVLLVNAYPGEASDLWVPPGGGAEAGTSLHENLVREVREETGLLVRPGRLVGLSEFHNPETGFHQVDLLFRVRLAGSEEVGLADPAGVVNRLHWACEAELAGLRVKPGILREVAFGARRGLVHEALDVMVP